MRWLTCLVFIIAASTGQAQQAPPTIQERMFNVCQEQRNAALTWHAGAEAQRGQLEAETKSLREEIGKLQSKLRDMEKKNAE